MKKLLKFAGLAIVAIAWASAAQPSFAQCAGACASELTQLLNLARLVDQLATQGNILTTGTNQLHLATVNTTPLSSPTWNSNTSGLQSYNSTLSSGNTISFAARTSSSLFTSQNSNYNSYVSSPPTSATAAAKYSAVVGEHQFKRALDPASRPTSIDRDDRYRANHAVRLENSNRLRSGQSAGTSKPPAVPYFLLPRSCNRCASSS